MATQLKRNPECSEAEWAARQDLAACYRIFDMLGWSESIYNHITVRVPGEEAFLINPFGLLWSEVTASNLIKIDSDGSPSPDATVELWTMPGGQGDLVLRIEADALGNFYTTAPLDLAGAPAFPFVRSADGMSANLMPFPTSSGACNVCHAAGGSNPVDVF